jgi:hypothetical protein
VKDKKLLVIAALAALAYWLYKKYGSGTSAGVTTAVSSTMVGSGVETIPTITTFPSEAVAGAAHPSAAPGIYSVATGGYLPTPGYQVQGNKIVPITASVQPKISAPIAGYGIHNNLAYSNLNNPGLWTQPVVTPGKVTAPSVPIVSKPTVPVSTLPKTVTAPIQRSVVNTARNGPVNNYRAARIA